MATTATSVWQEEVLMRPRQRYNIYWMSQRFQAMAYHGVYRAHPWLK